MKVGDVWLEHYRGSKYHFNPEGKVWWRSYLGTERVDCLRGHEPLLKSLQSLKPLGGSFRITEDKTVILRNVEGELEEPPEDEAFYAGKLEGEMKFEDVDINPDDLSPGDLWPGFYDGSGYHIAHDGRIFWREPGGLRWYADGDVRELQTILRQFKPLGGSFRINEYQCVIALLYKVPYPDEIRKQVEALTARQKEIIEEKRDRLRMVPIYLGRFDGSIEARRPPPLEEKWTEKRTEELVDLLHELGRR